MSADSSVALTPPNHRPRKRIVIAATALICFGAGAVAASWAIDTPTRVQVETFAQPVNVAIPPSPPPILVVPQPLAPPPPPVAEAPIRAATPFLDPACIASTLSESDATTPSASCDWSDGFPALSRDGTTVVTKFVPDDGGRGYPGLTVRFIDVRTSKTVRDVVLFAPDEYEPHHDETLDDAAAQALRATHKEELKTNIYRRIHQAQKLIDAKGYRSMVALGSSYETAEGLDTHTAVYAQVVRQERNAAVRVVDPATNTSLWRYTFGLPWTAPPRAMDPDSECSGLSLADISLAWDPQTRIALAENTWHYGGCMCGSDTTHEVVKL